MEIFATEARRLKLHGIPHSRKREKKKKKNQSRSRCQVLPGQGRNGPGRGSRGAISFLDVPRKIKGLLSGAKPVGTRQKIKLYSLAYHFPSPHFISHINWFFFFSFIWWGYSAKKKNWFFFSSFLLIYSFYIIIIIIILSFILYFKI